MALAKYYEDNYEMILERTKDRELPLFRAREEQHWEMKPTGIHPASPEKPGYTANCCFG